LDQETSGCMVVAKSDAAHLALAKQFTQRTVRKVYHALVCGVMPRDGGEIHAAITRHSNHRKRMVVSDERGREAWTSYRVLERLPRVTLVEAVIHTGRTHQVRVHFQYLGFPLAGDLIYGKRPNKLLAEVTGYTAPRVMLHACYLEFTHPASGERAAFESGWPPDFQAARQAYAALDSGSRKVDCG
jgi:23S rRNA pseudouridine1911/1915/1917 synthase